MRLHRLLILPLLYGCTTASTLAEDFVEPLEARLGADDQPGTIEGRLAELEERLSRVEQAVEDDDLDLQVAQVQSQVDDLTQVIDALDQALERRRVELWGIQEFSDRRVFNPNGTHSVNWSFPLSTSSPDAIQLEYFDCDAVLLNLRVHNRDANPGPVGLDVSPFEDMRAPARVEFTAELNEDDVLSAVLQLWVPSRHRSRLFVRSVPGANEPVRGLIYQTGCIR
ncbi:MAG: hypothetical protein EA397_11455 [Deltaproteobacteria bacterium]|nr:MAG: hypothetical protein EA397_11455 [Deltaproteobacteria bacterium]